MPALTETLLSPDYFHLADKFNFKEPGKEVLTRIQSEPYLFTRPWPPSTDTYENRQTFSCGSTTMAYIAAKPTPHREILLEKNINENIFQWILGYPCTVKQIQDEVGGRCFLST